MNRASFANTTNHQQANRVDALLKSNKQPEKNDFGTHRELSKNYLAAKVGFDLTHIPIHPSLRTTHQIQWLALV